MFHGPAANYTVHTVYRHGSHELTYWACTIVKANNYIANLIKFCDEILKDDKLDAELDDVTNVFWSCTDNCFEHEYGPIGQSTDPFSHMTQHAFKLAVFELIEPFVRQAKSHQPPGNYEDVIKVTCDVIWEEVEKNKATWGDPSDVKQLENDMKEWLA